MPQQVLPTMAEGIYLGDELRKMGFRRITRKDWKFARDSQELKVPRTREGYEIGYVYYANEYKVYVWTTLDAATKLPFQQDSGYVLIVGEDNKRLYSSPRLHRTKHFISRILSYAWIAKWKIDNRPLCSECSEPMKIVRGKHLKQRFWKCENRRDHDLHESVSVGWDYKVPEKAQKFLDSKRRKRAKYRKARRKAGKSTDTQMLKRKTWEGKKKKSSVKK